MNTRFEIAPAWVADLVAQVMDREFRTLASEEVQILTLFDLQRRMSQGRFILGRLAKAKDELKVVSKLAGGSAYDYVLYLDKAVFMRMEDADRIHLIKHELSHALGSETKNGDTRWGIVGHDFELFAWEAREPSWRERCGRWGEMAAALYETDAPMPAELPPTTGYPTEEEKVA